MLRGDCPNVVGRFPHPMVLPCAGRAQCPLPELLEPFQGWFFIIKGTRGKMTPLNMQLSR